jgi:transposase
LAGQRAHVAIPRNTPPNTTTIAALTSEGTGAAMVVRGSVDQVTQPTLYVPSYSPAYSPIELAISKFKTDKRRTAARTSEVLLTAIATAMASIIARDARAFFRHYGFRFLPDLDQWFCTSL